MKTLFACLFVVTLVACESESIEPTPEPVRLIDASVADLVETFYAEAAERGVSLPEGLIVQVVNSYADYDVRGNQYTLTLDKQRLDAYAPDQQEAYVYFYLGRVLLGRRLVIHIYSYMNPELWYGYDQNDREELFDEMFDPDRRVG